MASHTYDSSHRTTEQMKCVRVSGECDIKGDIRIVPFDDVHKIKENVERYVQEFNDGVEEGENRPFIFRTSASTTSRFIHSARSWEANPWPKRICDPGPARGG